ncbi:MAG: MCP four helix bundle domain-containing protein [Hungatella sp.]|jgi:methyl-accepting chemotaxis protein|nr:MCP four helix bundle domain-containing protein [Hungatella sp.]
MLKKLKVGNRLLVAFVIVVLFSGLAGTIGILLIRALNKEYHAELEDYGFAQGDIGSLGQAFQAHRATVLYIIYSEDGAETARQKENLAKQIDLINEKMQLVQARMKTVSEKELYSQLSEKMKSYEDIRSKTIELASKSSQESMAFFRSYAAPLAAEIADTINTMLSDKSAAGDIKSAQLSRQTSLFIAIMGTIIFISIGTPVIIAIAITRGITRPIDELKMVADRMAQGDFDIPHDPEEFKGEFRSVQLSIQNLTESHKLFK